MCGSDEPHPYPLRRFNYCNEQVRANEVQRVIVHVMKTHDYQGSILMIKPTRCTNFSNLLFGIKLYMFRTVPLSIIRSFFTVHAAMVYVLTACEQDQHGTSWSCSQAVSVRHTPLLCVQWKNPDDGQRNCPKHVEFYSMYMSYKFPDSLRAGSGWNVLILLASCTCNLYDIYRCCVYSEKNSWWWTEEMSETCRVLFQKINLRNQCI